MLTHVISPDRYRRMPWKNGGGVTTEIAVFPDGAGMDSFDWRISTARVDSPGPFSIFPGIDRSLAMLNGAGMTLQLAGIGTRTLKPGDPALVFPADIAVDATLAYGGIDDLNVMTRRGRYRHRLTVLPRMGGIGTHEAGATSLIYVRSGAAKIRTGRQGIALTQGQTLFLDGGNGVELAVERSRGAAVYVIDLWPV